MKKNFLIILVLLQGFLLQAQNLNFSWAKSFGGATNDIGFSVKTDVNGNVYSTGFFTGSADFDPGPGVVNLSTLGSQDIFITRQDPSGNLVWAKQIGGSYPGYSAVAYCIELDESGNFYITGNFEGVIDFDAGPGQFNLQTPNSAAFREVFVCKMDTDGNFIWARQFGSAGSGGMLATGVDVDFQGNVITTGFFSGPADFDPGPGVFNLNVTAPLQNMFVSKLSSSGNFVWAKQIGNHNGQCWGFGVASDAAGNIYTTGGFGGTVAVPGIVDFDPGAGSFNLTANPLTTDIFILKLDPAGNFSRVIQIGWGTNNMGRSIYADPDGDVYITGYYTENNSDVFITKLNASGNVDWSKAISGSGYEEAHSITRDLSGNIYVAGYFENNIDFDPGPAVSNMNSAGRSDVFILKLDDSGNYVWSKKNGGTDTDACYSVHADNQGNIYTAGSFTAVGDFDPGPAVFNLTANGSTDIFVQKLSRCQNISSSTLTVSACKNYTLNTQTYSQTGSYTQTLLNAAGCDSTITLNLTILPSASSIISKTICSGQTFEGHSTTGIYNDLFIAANGCDSVRTLNLMVQNLKIPELGPDKSFCKGDSIVLDPGDFQSYSWQDGSTKSQFVVSKPGTYTVQVQDQCGIATDQVTVTENICTVYIPSGFTPNKDGKNDVFKVFTHYQLENFRLLVFNRWGEKIFESKNSSSGWNGMQNGQLLDTGIFAWYIEYRLPGKSELISAKGTVSLIR